MSVAGQAQQQRASVCGGAFCWQNTPNTSRAGCCWVHVVGEKRDVVTPGALSLGNILESEKRRAELLLTPVRVPQVMMTFPLHLKHTCACPLPMGWATSFLLPSTALECTQRHRLRVGAQVCTICVICVICKPPRPLQEGRECPASPIPCQEHLRQGCRCACSGATGQAGQWRGEQRRRVGQCGPSCSWSVRFSPKKP